MTNAKAKPKAIDLGALQEAFTSARATLRGAETALARAQESRDRAKASLDVAQAALAHSVRSVIG